MHSQRGYPSTPRRHPILDDDDDLAQTAVGRPPRDLLGLYSMDGPNIPLSPPPPPPPPPIPAMIPVGSAHYLLDSDFTSVPIPNNPSYAQIPIIFYKAAESFDCKALVFCHRLSGYREHRILMLCTKDMLCLAQATSATAATAAAAAAAAAAASTATAATRVETGPTTAAVAATAAATPAAAAAATAGVTGSATTAAAAAAAAASTTASETEVSNGGAGHNSSSSRSTSSKTATAAAVMEKVSRIFSNKIVSSKMYSLKSVLLKKGSLTMIL